MAKNIICNTKCEQILTISFEYLVTKVNNELRNNAEDGIHSIESCDVVCSDHFTNGNATKTDICSPKQSRLPNCHSNMTSVPSSIKDSGKIKAHGKLVLSEFQTRTANEDVKSKIKRDQEISLAVTLVVIAIVFICCQSVKLITDVYELLNCDRPSNNQTSSTNLG